MLAFETAEPELNRREIGKNRSGISKETVSSYAAAARRWSPLNACSLRRIRREHIRISAYRKPRIDCGIGIKIALGRQRLNPQA